VLAVDNRLIGDEIAVVGHVELIDGEIIRDDASHAEPNIIKVNHDTGVAEVFKK
jgi:hypothetical protein